MYTEIHSTSVINANERHEAEKRDRVWCLRLPVVHRKVKEDLLDIDLKQV